MNKYVLKMYTWIDGMLTLVKHEFDCVEDAIEHAEEKLAHSFKIFDSIGNLIHSHSPVKPHTYA